jgi:hypothetical protein
MLFAAVNTWSQKADLGGGARFYAVGFSIGSKGYIGTGFYSQEVRDCKDFWEYDPAANTWTQKADFGGTARDSAVGFSIGSKGYIGTGFYKDFWEYDPAANTWTQKADFGGTARGFAVGFSIGSKGYIGTGQDNKWNFLKDFWEYDPGIVLKGDFNADGKTDFIWQNTTTGQLYYWLMDGLNISSSGYLYNGSPVGLEWRIDGIGDLNSDGKSDLIWRNTSTGTLYYWLMDGLNLSSSGYLYNGNPVGLEWQIAGVGDMNSDGKPDLIWRNTSGQLYYWLMDGLTLSSSGYMYDGNPVALEWQIAGVGDMNSDGKSDLIWHNTSTGQVYYWLMDGLTLSSSGYLYDGNPVGLAWRIAGIADMNADGKPDLIWRNTSTGTLYYWLMDGLILLSSGYMYDGNPVGLEWDLRLK